MKLIIEIPEENYDNKTLVDYFGCYSKMLDATIYNGTPIPDNATNGDMIKALFPTADISLNDSCFEGVVSKYGFDMKWWNAPYQKGGKE